MIRESAARSIAYAMFIYLVSLAIWGVMVNRDSAAIATPIVDSARYELVMIESGDSYIGDYNMTADDCAESLAIITREYKVYNGPNTIWTCRAQLNIRP